MVRRDVPAAGAIAASSKQRQRMDYFAQQLIHGLVGMINFAHGDIFMIGGFIALISFLILVSIGLTVVPVILLIVLLVSMAITALYGWTVERIAYRPLYRADFVPDPGLDRPHRGSRDPADRAAGIDGDHSALWLDRGANRLPAALSR